jgi:hypothetical protein
MDSVCDYLEQRFSHLWIGRQLETSKEDAALPDLADTVNICAGERS